MQVIQNEAKSINEYINKTKQKILNSSLIIYKSFGFQLHVIHF